MAKTKHIGFKKASAQIASKEGIPIKNANAILASSTRKAAQNPKTLAKNPNLAKVAQKKKK